MPEWRACQLKLFMIDDSFDFFQYDENAYVKVHERFFRIDLLIPANAELPVVYRTS